MEYSLGIDDRIIYEFADKKAQYQKLAELNRELEKQNMDLANSLRSMLVAFLRLTTEGGWATMESRHRDMLAQCNLEAEKLLAINTNILEHDFYASIATSSFENGFERFIKMNRIKEYINFTL